MNDNKKNIIISGENIFFRRNFMSLIESFLHRVFGDKKYKIVDKLDKIIPKAISNIRFTYFVDGYVKLYKQVENGELKNTYFILSNVTKSPNNLVFPFFLQDNYLAMKKLVKKRVKKEWAKRKFCVFLVTSNSSRERVDFFKRLSRYKKVDSYGKVMNNMGNKLYNQKWNCNPDINILNGLFGLKKEDPNNHWRDEPEARLMAKGWKGTSELLRKYKFVICFENSLAEEYIGEKLTCAMLSNCVPIYRGPKSVKKYFNTDSFINYDDYGSYDKMIEKIIELDKDDNKYLELLSKPWFKDNKVPRIIKDKEKELIRFYEKVLGVPSKN